MTAELCPARIESDVECIKGASHPHGRMCEELHDTCRIITCDIKVDVALVL